MKKNNIVLFGLAALACLFLFTNIALAQDIAATTTMTDDTVVEEIDEKLPADVALDEKVTTQDLGAVEASVLPGSALHIFKRFGWAVQEIFETDPVADAELKIQHANQELSELKQLIEERGFSDVDPSVINAVMARFEGRLDNVNNVAEAIKDLKESDPEAVDGLLNNLTDKQFKYQKVLESIERDVIKEREENEDANKGIEDIFVKVTETKDKTLEHYGKVMETVEDGNAEKIAERIIRVTDKQDGSEFKHLKNLEVLNRLEEQVPASAKGAIALAQENTLKFFNRDIAALPEDERAERFENYSRLSYGDETRQLSFLDDLKLSDDISPEILKKIEEVKEFAIAKFEKKMSGFKQPNVLDSYMGHLSGENFDDMVMAEQLASRVVFENNPEIKQRMDEIKNKSVQEFTNRFTDPESQTQIAKFQELERILEERPGDPKVIKMMQELEAQVRSDPTKAAFLDQISQLENKMGAQLEEKFRQEGDKYFDRIGTLDPRDFEVYQQFKGENFLPEDMANKFLESGVVQYRDYMKDVDSPEQFDRFNTKFNNISQSVINEIRQRDNEFGDAMQFKRQAMEKLRFEQERQMEIKRQAVDYTERELMHQLNRARRQADEDFWQRVNSIPYENFDERKALFEEKKKADLARLDEENKARLEIFNKRLELDPWCDSACRQIQKQFIDQEFRHQRERIQDDYISQQKQIEFDLSRAKETNPLFGLCNTKESCDSYCKANPNVEACKPFFNYQMPYNDFNDGPKDYDCGPGKYFDFEHNECRLDPYYKPPTNFTQCKLGSHWNNERGFCEPDFIPKPIVDQDGFKKPDCGPDNYFDFKENKCVSYRIAPICPDLAVMEPIRCPEGSYRGPDVTDQNGCRVFGECIPSERPSFCPDIAAMYIAPCPAGQQRDIIVDSNGCKAFGQCTGDLLPPVTCDAYFEGYEYNSATDRCEFRSTSGCSNPYKYRTLTECQNGNVTGIVPAYPTSSNWVNKTWYFNDGSTSSSVLNRTDSEYLNYIANIEAQCKAISQNSFAWKPGAGDDSSSNWQNFGIPDCSGSAQPTYPTYPTSIYPTSTYEGDENSCPGFAYSVWDQSGVRYCQLNNSYSCDYNYPSYLTNDGSYTEANCPVYDSQTTTTTYPASTYVGDSGCSDILDILPGCHTMSESPNVRFNSAMDQYVEVGTRTIQYCSSSMIPGCSSYYSSNGNTGSSTYCPSPSYWDPAINGCAPATDTSSTYCPSPSYWDSATGGCVSGGTTPSCDGAGGFTCPSGYEYDANGCVSGCLPDYVEPACPNSPQNLTCDYGYEYDSTGCQTGCIPPPSSTTTETPPAEEPPPAASVWKALKALFGF